jgi:hypothetical protein
MTDNSLKKDIRKLIQLIDYRLCDIFQFIPIRGGKLYGLLNMSMGTLCLLNQSYFKSDVYAL